MRAALHPGSPAASAGVLLARSRAAWHEELQTIPWLPSLTEAEREEAAADVRVVAGITVRRFDWLLDRSIAFNRFVMQQLNERLGQFIAAREIDRLTHPDERVARNLAALFHPVLYPGVGEMLRITQQELGYLVGLSRQRVNQALRALQQSEVIRIEYGGVRVLDLEGLRRYAQQP
jgi:CRP-like cAMP-binding protein